MQPASSTDQTIVIRPARADDERALLRLAALDSTAALRGPRLVADVDGRLLAALSLHDGRTIADPFRPTADLVELLQIRARLMGAAGATPRHGRHSLRRSAPTVALP